MSARQDRRPIGITSDEHPLAPYRKALVSAAGAGVVAIGTAMLDGDLTNPEVVAAAGGAILAGGATWRVRNARRRP